jgi:hypothetical protein
MGLFQKIAKLGLDVVTTPLDVAADVSTLGGLTSDRKKLYTESKAEDLAKDVADIIDEIFG